MMMVFVDQIYTIVLPIQKILGKILFFGPRLVWKVANFQKKYALKKKNCLFFKRQHKIASLKNPKTSHKAILKNDQCYIFRFFKLANILSSWKNNMVWSFNALNFCIFATFLTKWGPRWKWTKQTWFCKTCCIGKRI